MTKLIIWSSYFHHRDMIWWQAGLLLEQPRPEPSQHSAKEQQQDQNQDCRSFILLLEIVNFSFESDWSALVQFCK